jgi:hypothetical protein
MKLLMLAHEDITLPSPGGERQRLSPESGSRAGAEKQMPPESKRFTLRRHFVLMVQRAWLKAFSARRRIVR